MKPGTYLYQSGTQPQVQVQMGLYGAVTKNAADADRHDHAERGRLTQARFAYDNQATLLYSEIDPALHAAVASGSLRHRPADQHLRLRAQVLPDQRPALHIRCAGHRAGRQSRTQRCCACSTRADTHVPMIQGNYWEVVAEDGKPYPYPTHQYTALLPAAKTMDVLLTPRWRRRYAIMDRRLSLSNNGMSDGGMLAFVGWGALASGGGTGSGNGGANQPPLQARLGPIVQSRE